MCIRQCQFLCGCGCLSAEDANLGCHHLALSFHVLFHIVVPMCLRSTVALGVAVGIVHLLWD